MAKRAIERLDQELARTLFVGIDRADARRVLTALEAQGQQTTSLPPELARLRDDITRRSKRRRTTPRCRISATLFFA